MSHRWTLAINAAQKERVVMLGDTAYRRLPYGQERASVPEPRLRPCRNCGVLVGQMHVYPCPSEVCACCENDPRILCEMAGCTAHIRQAP